LSVVLPTRPLILGTGDVILGACLLLGGPGRTSSRAYAGIKQVQPVDAWGVELALIGVLLLAGVAARHRVSPRVGHAAQRGSAFAAACWCGFWAGTLIYTAATDPLVGYTGGALWLLWGAIPHLWLWLGREG
jgi:hypothetical protein